MSQQSFSYDDIIRDAGQCFFSHLANSIRQILRENGTEEQVMFVEAFNDLSEFVSGRSLDVRVGDNPDARQRLRDVIMCLSAMQARFNGQIRDGWPGLDLNGPMLQLLRAQQDREVVLSWRVLQASHRAQRGTVDHEAQAVVEEVAVGLEQALQLVQGGNEHGVIAVNLGAGVEVVPGAVAVADQEHDSSDTSDSDEGDEIEPC